MKRPNLTNPNHWSPFKSIPVSTHIQSEVSIPKTPEIYEIPRSITRKELIQRNSAFLNFVCLIIIGCISYFLYSIYLERKIFAEYLEYVQNASQERYYSN